MTTLKIGKIGQNTWAIALAKMLTLAQKLKFQKT